MRKSSLAVLAVLSIGLLAAQAGAVTVYSADFDAGYTVGPLWGQPADSGQPWDSSVYSSNPAGTGDTWLSNPNVIVDPTNAANQVVQFYGDCSGGEVHGAAASVVVSADAAKDITFSQSAYFDSSTTAGASLCMSVLSANGGCQWGGNQNLTFGNYSYFVKHYDATVWDGIQSGLVAWSLWNSDTGNYESILVPKDTWATAEVTFHVDTLTADLVVTANGVTQQLLGIPTAYIVDSVIGGQTRYDIYTDGDTNVVANLLLDNVQITQVPEPMTLALLALGGAALLRRKH